MNNDEKQSKTGLPSSGILWLLLLGAGALFLKEVPWQGARPVGSEVRTYAYPARQDVDARLWQDPIGAVVRARSAAKQATVASSAARPGLTNHTMIETAQEVENRLCKGHDVLLLGAMVAGGPYPEWAEFRRRARYAVLAGLSETGFVPEDELHLGYFTTADASPKQETKTPLPEFVAYEWMNPAETEPLASDGSAIVATTSPAVSASATSRKLDVLLLWLDEDRVGKEMGAQVEHIAASFEKHCPDGKRGPNLATARFAVLGPSTTWPLQEMIATALGSSALAVAARATPAAPGPLANRIATAFYAYGSTASDRSLLADVKPGATGMGATFTTSSSAATPTGTGALPGNSTSASSPSVHTFLRDHRIALLFRTIGSDDKLAEQLTKELGSRNVWPGRNSCLTSEQVEDPSQHRPEWKHVVLIAERDSFYGRSLSRTVAAKFSNDQCTVPGRDYSPWIHPYSYLGGLDGQLPTTSTANSDSESKDDAGSNTKSGTVAANGDPKRIERSEGPGQLDYLRRLTDQLVALDDRLRLGRRGSIRAIGVLGSDVYDKLLILQAVRAYFPNAIVFTTDMDARFLHPQQLDWTHNAIVASNFGLDLGRRLQGDIAPFRDSYQTSLFLSTMIAVGNARKAAAQPGGTCEVLTDANEADCLEVDQKKIQEWLTAPRVFEIGRKAAFDFSLRPDGRTPYRHDNDSWTSKECRQGKADTCCSPGNLAACLDVHPPSSPMYAKPALQWIQLAVGLLAGLVLLFGLFNGGWVGQGLKSAVSGAEAEVKERQRHILRWSLVATLSVLLGLLVTISFAWESFADWLTEHGAGEPIAFFLGVSTWPTEFLRGLAFLTSAVFFVWAWHALDRNLDSVSERLLLLPARKELLKQLEQEEKEEWSWWQRAVRVFSFRLVESGSTGPVNPKTGLAPQAERFWKKYLYQGRMSARLARIIPITLAYFFAGVFIIQANGQPVPPYRGEWLKLIDPVLIGLSVFAMLLLIFFVVDATIFAYQLVSALRNRAPLETSKEPEVDIANETEARWPEGTLRYFGRKFQLRPRYLDDWITMHFVARRTEAVAKLVYFPFIVISLMILARSSVFDNWNTPTGLVIVISTSVLIVIGCAVALRQAAERLRTSAIWRLSNAIVMLNGQGDAGRQTAAQLQAMIGQVRGFYTGAFAPYSEQPLVRALLLPLTSYGGTALVEYLSIANF